MDGSDLRRELLLIEGRLMEIRKDFVAELEQVERRIGRASSRLATTVQRDLQEKCEALPWDKFLDRLGVRSRKALKKLSVTDSTRLAALTLDDLRALKNCGRTTILEITSLLNEYGIELPERVQS